MTARVMHSRRSDTQHSGPRDGARGGSLMAKGNKNRSKKNKPKLTIQQKKDKKAEKKAQKS